MKLAAYSIPILLAVIISTPTLADAVSAKDWGLEFDDFMIGAWWGPSSTDADVKIYKQAGFNVVMIGRYMQLEEYGDAGKGLEELDLAQKYNLGVMFDTYTMNDKPWGGIETDHDPHGTHHSATLPELKWLNERLGDHPALIGFLLGDDYGALTPQLQATNRWMRENTPHLYPWICQNAFNPASLAANGNPAANPQIYPTLYSWQLSSEQLAQSYLSSYQHASRECAKHGVMFWPMLNTANWTHGKLTEESFGGWCPSDSLVRFPAYAALAYGAQGIWYFTYSGGALHEPGDYNAVADVKAALTPLYPVVKKANQRIAKWGPRMLARESVGIFGTAFSMKATDWPFGVESLAGPSPEGFAAPADGKLVESMDQDLMVGILTLDGEQPLAMVVDCRTTKNYDDLKPRRATIRFADSVDGIKVLRGNGGPLVAGSAVTLKLDAGEGQLLELAGDDWGDLCTRDAIYAPVQQASIDAADVSDASDLSGILAAKLRIEINGANPEDEYADKFIDLNGNMLCRVPSTGDWAANVIDLSDEQLAWVSVSNELTVRTECADAWKFRNVTLAVQLADGSWAMTNTHGTIHSSPGWAYSEGVEWGGDGLVGPIALAF